MTRPAVEALIADRYVTVGFAPPQMIWAYPTTFAAEILRARQESTPDSAAAAEAGCWCAACTHIHITHRIVGHDPHGLALAPDFSLSDEEDRDWFVLYRQPPSFLTSLIKDLDTGSARRIGLELRFADHDRDQRPWGWRFSIPPEDPTVFDALSAVADAWSFTPSVAVLLAAGRWSFHESGVLHDVDGHPAAEWADGTVTAWEHGRRLPDWVHDEIGITPERILAEESQETRRFLVARYGFDRWVNERRDATLVDDDPVRGQLWDLGFRDETDSESVRMIRVLDATPTPGGDRRVHWLRVPPIMETAHEAVAWTFGMDSDRYNPLEET